MPITAVVHNIVSKIVNTETHDTVRKMYACAGEWRSHVTINSCRNFFALICGVRMRRKMAGSRDDRNKEAAVAPFFAAFVVFSVLVQCSVSSSGQQMS